MNLVIVQYAYQMLQDVSYNQQDDPNNIDEIMYFINEICIQFLKIKIILCRFVEKLKSF